MRILIINYEFPPLGGGGGVASYQLARELAKRHQVDVLTSGYGDLPDYEVKEEVEIYRVPAIGRSELERASTISLLSYLPLSLGRGLALTRKRGYHVFNTWFAIPSGPTGVVLAWMTKTPNILTIIGGDIYDPSKRSSPHRHPFLKQVVRLVLRKADTVVAISSDIGERAREYHDYQRDIEVVALGVGREKRIVPPRREMGLEEGGFYLIAVGRLIPRKGLHYLIEALARIEDGEVKLLIVGGGPEGVSLESLARRLGVKERVTFLGLVSEEEKFHYLANSDLFVLPSLHEGFGIVFIEAMECGLAVIATDRGGQLDFLRDGETGFLVPSGDINALVARIELLRQDESLRARISSHNREYAKRFCVSDMARKYEGIFERAISQFGGED